VTETNRVDKLLPSSACRPARSASALRNTNRNNWRSNDAKRCRANKLSADMPCRPARSASADEQKGQHKRASSNDVGRRHHRWGALSMLSSSLCCCTSRD